MRLKIGQQQLEYVWHGPLPHEAPTIVFLHEGLGCAAMWRDFPEQLSDETGFGALVYSRAGYGSSDPVVLPRPVRFMHDEALITLPAVLDATSVRDCILVGHSDGGSISLIYAGGVDDDRICGLVLEAPHVFVEQFGLDSISRARDNYESGNLKTALERHHGKNVECAFRGWNDVWLSPQFRAWNLEEYLPKIQVPILVIQGEDDQYGTLRQVEAIERDCAVEVETLILPECGHSPHCDQPEHTLDAITRFIKEKLFEETLFEIRSFDSRSE